MLTTFNASYRLLERAVNNISRLMKKGLDQIDATNGSSVYLVKAAVVCILTLYRIHKTQQYSGSF